MVCVAQLFKKKQVTIITYLQLPYFALEVKQKGQFSSTMALSKYSGKWLFSSNLVSVYRETK